MALCVVLSVLLLASACHCLDVGPCHKVKTVELDEKEYTGVVLVNFETHNTDTRCQYVRRDIVKKNGSSHLREFFSRYENGKLIESTIVATKVGKGEYVYNKTVNGETVLFKASILFYKGRELEIHYVCTDNPAFKNKKGIVFVLGKSINPTKTYAKQIETVLKKNNMKKEDLMVVDNCNCPNFPKPLKHEKCKKMSAKDYFGL